MRVMVVIAGRVLYIIFNSILLQYFGQDANR
jgi:hypothetical protein